MKKNELTQIKGLDLKELSVKAKALKGEIAGLIIDKNMKKLKDVKAVSKKRKDLAQVLTIIRQKQLLVELESRVEDEKIKKGGNKRIEKSVQRIVKNKDNYTLNAIR